MTARLVTIFGGAGFIGRHLVQRLAQKGYRIRVPVRDPNAAAILQPLGNVGQIVSVQANLRNAESVRAAVTGSDVVINLVGILYESGAQTFAAVHERGARIVAEAARDAGVGSFVQMSALGAAADSPSRYGRSKAAGETAVRAALPDAVIVRPSIVFGANDTFFNRFAAMARISPALPLIGGGHTRFQPVWVGDVAEAIVRAVEDEDCRGRTFELGGPRVYSFRELMQVVLTATGRKRLLLPLPFGLARFEAMFLQMLPAPPLTVDQVDSLTVDNVVADGAEGFAALDIRPASVEAVVPSYLARYRRAGVLPKKLA
ncbi:complex I NDUFA9 subunit family protein [Oceanibacterium hippocampi]|uniref:dTDP-4-dehydrorhamnose reductase n=1 Tax=Oceanibacterium hippocampi TaxID=745714 RepID=A0A1Y5RQY2_9PROT|nr:complex I NDUFA9 subunit family protein [Oceanibacterium hippocampi]SLN23284.1 dTDP-4-dehydrorhamnose reductase [Oceanibacterium hippocampi]